LVVGVYLQAEQQKLRKFMWPGNILFCFFFGLYWAKSVDKFSLGTADEIIIACLQVQLHLQMQSFR